LNGRVARGFARNWLALTVLLASVPARSEPSPRSVEQSVAALEGSTEYVKITKAHGVDQQLNGTNPTAVSATPGETYKVSGNAGMAIPFSICFVSHGTMACICHLLQL